MTTARQRVNPPAEAAATPPAADSDGGAGHGHAHARSDGARRGRARAAAGRGAFGVCRRVTAPCTRGWTPNQQAAAAVVIAVGFMSLLLVLFWAYIAARAPVRPTTPAPAAVPVAGSGEGDGDVHEMDADARGAARSAHAADALWSVSADVLSAEQQDVMYADARDTARHVFAPPPPLTGADADADAVDAECVRAVGGDARALPCQRLHLVLARHRESLAWLHGAPIAADGTTPVTAADAQWLWRHVPSRSLYDQHNAFSPYFLAPNVGHEAHAYLTFIVAHYHQLPRVVVFAQALPFDHNARWVRYVQLLRDSTPHHPLPYTPLMVLSDVDAGGARAANAAYVTSDAVDMLRYAPEWDRWARDFPGAAVKPFPADQRMGAYDRALFAVSREVIRANPLALYESLLSALVAHTNDWSDARSFGALMEFSWHALFGEHWTLPRWHSTPRARAEYCARSFVPGACAVLFPDPPTAAPNSRKQQ